MKHSHHNGGSWWELLTSETHTKKLESLELVWLVVNYMMFLKSYLLKWEKLYFVKPSFIIFQKKKPSII